MSFKNLPNKKKAEYYRVNYRTWRRNKFDYSTGFFPIYEDFYNKEILSKISGNALKLYLYLGLKSNNQTGESWHTIESISDYFNKSPRTISYWITELENLKLIQRIQLELNSPAHTYLQPY